MTVEQIVRDRRIELKLSKAEVARQLGMRGGEFLTMAEAGVRHWPLRRIPMLATILEINHTRLIRAWLQQHEVTIDEILFEGNVPSLAQMLASAKND